VRDAIDRIHRQRVQTDRTFPGTRLQIVSRRSAEGRRIGSGETLGLARGNHEIPRPPTLVHTVEASAY